MNHSYAICVIITQFLFPTLKAISLNWSTIKFSFSLTLMLLISPNFFVLFDMTHHSLSNHYGIGFPLLVVVRTSVHFVVYLPFRMVVDSIDHFASQFSMVVIPRFLLLFVATKPPSLAIDGMAPFVSIIIFLVDWLSSPHCFPMFEIFPPPFDLQPLLPVASLLQVFTLCQHCSNLILSINYITLLTTLDATTSLSTFVINLLASPSWGNDTYVITLLGVADDVPFFFFMFSNIMALTSTMIFSFWFWSFFL